MSENKFLDAIRGVCNTGMDVRFTGNKHALGVRVSDFSYEKASDSKHEETQFTWRELELVHIPANVVADQIMRSSAKLFEIRGKS